tara:strand:- start:7665 stop:8486 length:822 start_codon:yes stop_codon:yes gene_type:complete
MGPPPPWITFNKMYNEYKGFFLNSAGIYTNLGLIYRNMVITTAYCDSSKALTDIVCDYNKDKYKAFDMVGFMKIKELIKKTASITDEMKKNYNAIDVLKKRAKELSKNTEKINSFNLKNQESLLCNMAKGSTHTICQMNYFWKKALTGDFSIGIIDFRQMAWIISQIIRITDAVLTGDKFNEKGTLKNIQDVQDNYEKLDILNDFALRTLKQKKYFPSLDKITKFKFKFPNQRGGLKHISPYDYINDPNTNNMVHVKSDRGREILYKYTIYNK